MYLLKRHSIEWLIIIIIKELSSSIDRRIIDQTIEEIEHVGSPENEVLLVLDKFQLDDDASFHFSTSIQRLVPMSNNPPLFKFREMDGEIDFDYSNSRSWTILLKWIVNNFHANRTIMVTHSHGCGYGVFGDKFQGRDKFAFSRNNITFLPTSYEKLINSLFPSYPKTNSSAPFKFRKKDYYQINRSDNDEYCKNIEMLWITELEQALANSFGSQMIDIMMMVNCYMQTFDTGWILRNQVKYLVAPETVIQAYGYSFESMLKILNDFPQITTLNFLKTIIPSFKSKWLNIPNAGQVQLNRVTVIITNLWYYNALKFLFEQIVKTLISCSDVELDRIIQVRVNLVNVTKDPGGTDATEISFIDLTSFLKSLLPLFPNNLVTNNSIERFINLVEKCIVDRHIGQAFINFDNDSNNITKYSLNGISIFLPSDLLSNNNTYRANCAYFGRRIILPIPVEDTSVIPLANFTNSSLWDNFIVRYLLRLNVLHSGL